MKEVAIITLPLNNYNYGGILQAFALQSFLKNTFDTSVHHIDRQYNVSTSVRMKMKIHDLLNFSLYKSRQAYYSPMERFITENIKLSKPIYSPQVLDKYLRSRKVEVLVTGSDQVWRKQYAFNVADDLFLKVPYDCKKISYAASFGAEDYKEDGIKNKLEHLDGISVREKSAQKYLTLLGLQALHHIDPTLLLDWKTYSEMAERSEKDYKRAITVYMLDRNENTLKKLHDLAESRAVPLNFVGEKVDITRHSYRNITTTVDSIEDWLRAFRDADYVVTDSFHGCVFSILFNKQFITVGNVERGLSRFLSLLEIFGLQDRLVTSCDYLDVLFRPIDYEKINNLLESHRQRSIDYFRDIFYT